MVGAVHPRERSARRPAGCAARTIERTACVAEWTARSYFQAGRGAGCIAEATRSVDRLTGYYGRSDDPVTGRDEWAAGQAKWIEGAPKAAVRPTQPVDLVDGSVDCPTDSTASRNDSIESLAKSIDWLTRSIDRRPKSVDRRTNLLEQLVRSVNRQAKSAESRRIKRLVRQDDRRGDRLRRDAPWIEA